MTPKEALMVVALLNRAGLVNVVEGQAEVWRQVLADVSFADAQTAVTKIMTERTSENSWVVPGDVLQAVRQLRGDRVKDALGGLVDPMPPREIDPDDVGAYQAWRKTFIRALGDGAPLHTAETMACDAVGIPAVHRSVIEFYSTAQIES